MKKLSLAQLRAIWAGSGALSLDTADYARIDASAQTVQTALASGAALYGINTGFGKLASTRIDADKLEVQQKDNKAIYSGDVVVVQGKTTMRCTALVIFFEQKKDEAKKQPAAQPAAATKAQPATTPGQPGASGLKRLECHGPVSVTQEKQTATSNLLVYEADAVTLTGNVILADGDNVQAGEKMIYNTKTGVGTMVGGAKEKESGRVRGIFLPGSGGEKDPTKKAEKKDKTG